MKNKFFGKATSIGRLEFDETALTADSASIQVRLDRIEGHYKRLDQVLTELEARIFPPENKEGETSGTSAPRKPR